MNRNAILMACCVASSLGAMPARAQTADVIHWWTSGSESKAVAVFAEEYRKRGGTWVDSAVVGGPAARASALNRMAGGNPPTAMQWNVGVAVRQLAEQGMLANLDAIAKRDGWLEQLPPLLVQKISVAGHIYAVPVDIADINMVFYSTKIFNELGLQPAKTWDEFFTIADKIKAAGYIPLAVGGQAWQEELLFQNVALGTAGPDIFRKVFLEHDAKAAASPEMLHAFEVMRRLSTYADQGSPNRKWNDTELLVANNKAAMQIMGDWAKGEFLAGNLKLGQDFGCAPSPGTDGALIVTVDVFAFPKIDTAPAIAARDKLAAMMMDPAVQVAFNRAKGAVPPLRNAKMTPLDACSTVTEDIVQNHPDKLLPNMQLAFSADTEGQIGDLITQFWNTPAMSAAAAAKQFVSIIGGADS